MYMYVKCHGIFIVAEITCTCSIHEFVHTENKGMNVLCTSSEELGLASIWWRLVEMAFTLAVTGKYGQSENYPRRTDLMRRQMSN